MEFISFGTPSAKPPLLFIHGSYCGAWIWEKYFLPAFAQAGYAGAALSLRGHGKSEGRENLNSFGIQDYLEDIAEGVRLLGASPVLVGHSLGGYLAQKYAISNSVAGLVLLSSPSLMGLCGSAQHIALKNPQLVMELGKLVACGPTFASEEVILKAFIKDPTFAKESAFLLPHLQGESARVSLEASWPEWRRPSSLPPTLVIGGTADDFVPEQDFRFEATYWSGTLKIMQGVSHGLMLDSCWPQVVNEMTSWLKTVGK